MLGPISERGQDEPGEVVRSQYRDGNGDERKPMNVDPSVIIIVVLILVAIIASCT